MVGETALSQRALPLLVEYVDPPDHAVDDRHHPVGVALQAALRALGDFVFVEAGVVVFQESSAQVTSESGEGQRWHKVSMDKSGKCDVVVSQQEKVYGVLFQILVHERRELDLAEGLGHGHRTQQFQLEHEGQSVEALAYVATRTDPRLRPTAEYKAHVLAGAREHSLPQEYVAGLLDG